MLPSLKLHRSHVAAGKCWTRTCNFLTFAFVIAKGICGLHSCSGQKLCRCLWHKVYPTLRYFSKIIAAKGSISCLPQNTKSNALKCQKKKATEDKRRNKLWIYQSHCTVKSIFLFSEIFWMESKDMILCCITVTLLDIIHLWVSTHIWLPHVSGAFLSPFIFLWSLFFHSWFNFYTLSYISHCMFICRLFLVFPVRLSDVLH